MHVSPADEIVLYKYAAVLDSLNYEPESLVEKSIQTVALAAAQQYDALFANHMHCGGKLDAQRYPHTG